MQAIEGALQTSAETRADKGAVVHVTSNTPREGKEFVSLYLGEYETDLIVSLAKYDFKVRLNQFMAPSVRYALSLETRFLGLCEFPRYTKIESFKLIVTDLTANEVVMVVEQTGSSGPCNNAAPVFDSMAQSLAKNW